MNTLTHVTIVPGWTLRPQDNWYQEVATYLEEATPVQVQIAAMPTPDTPDPIEWKAALDEYVRPSENQLVIAHSLGFMATVNWAAERATVDSGFRLGSILSVAGNVSSVGFDEIAPHFADNVPALEKKMVATRRALIHQPVGIYGAHDPFVGIEHGELVRAMLHASILVDMQQGHFSAMYADQHKKLYVPAEPHPDVVQETAITNSGYSVESLWDKASNQPGQNNSIVPYDKRLHESVPLVRTQWFGIATAAEVMINVARGVVRAP